MESENTYSAERETLHKQFELLAEKSKDCANEETLAKLTAQMIAIYSVLHIADC